jgi:hypothetical protein
VVNKKVKRRLFRFSLKYLWPLLPTVLILAALVYLSQSHFFSLKKINCYLEGLPCPHRFEPLLLSLRNKNIFTLSTVKLKQIIANQDLDLTDIQISKTLPYTLTIELHQRQPVAQLIPTLELEFTGLSSTASATLSAQLGQQFFRLDKTGVIYAPTDQPEANLPRILTAPGLVLPSAQSDATRLLAQLVIALEEHYVSFEELAWLNPNLIVIKTIPYSYALIDPAASLDSQVASLQYILSNSKIEERLPKKIDLRFAKPVLIY